MEEAKKNCRQGKVESGMGKKKTLCRGGSINWIRDRRKNRLLEGNNLRSSEPQQGKCAWGETSAHRHPVQPKRRQSFFEGLASHPTEGKGEKKEGSKEGFSKSRQSARSGTRTKCVYRSPGIEKGRVSPRRRVGWLWRTMR